MDFHRLLDVMEHAPDRRRLFAAGDALRGPVRHQVDVELRPVVLDAFRERRGHEARLDVRRVEGDVPREKCLEVRQVMARGELEPVHQHDGLQPVVDHDGEHRVLEAADVDRFIVKRVLDPAQPPDLLCRVLPGRRLGRRHHQHFEVGFLCRAGIDIRRREVEYPLVALAARIPGGLVAAEVPGQQRPRNFLHEPREHRGIAAVERFADAGQEPTPRVRPAMLDAGKRRELAGRIAAQLRGARVPGSSRRPCAGQRVELAPLVDTRTGRGKHRREVACAPDICRARHSSRLLSQSE